MEVDLPHETRALLDAVVAIGSGQDLPVVLRRLVESACSLTGATFGVLATVDERGEILELITHGMTSDEVTLIGRMPRGHGLLGLVPRQREPLRLAHLADHEQSVGYPDAHPAVDRFLGAPVLVGKRVLGHLYLGNPGSRPEFTSTDEVLLEALARAAGVMMANSRDLEESRRRRIWLEASVRIASAFAPELGGEEALQRLVDELLDLAHAEDVVLVQPDDDLLQLSAAAGPSGGAAVVERLAKEIRRAAESGEPVQLRSGGAVTLVMPISTSVAGPGVLVIDGAAGWPRTIEMEAELLGALARQVGLALDRAAAMSERHQLVLAKDRDRIARDLHDLVIQRLFATGLQLQGARGARGEELRHRVDEAVQELDVAITDLRATIFELGRGASRSLREEVRALVSEYAAVLGFLPLLRLVGPVDRALAPAALDQLLLTLREALSNIARHAAASRATVELLATPAWFILRVTDDGGGIDLEALEGPSGLGNARHRAEELGGRLSVGPAPTGGTRLEWVVPVLA